MKIVLTLKKSCPICWGTYNLLKNINPDESEIVFKVNLEIQKLLSDFSNYSNKLGIPYKEGSLVYSNVFTPYMVPVGFYNTYGINKNFFNQVEVLINKVKFIVSVITLRNELINSLIKSDNQRKTYLKVKLDSMGLLMNYYQLESLNKLDEQNNILKEGFNQISSLLDDVVSKLEVLGRINENLEKIDETISFGNILKGIQTYQLYKINKNT